MEDLKSVSKYFLFAINCVTFVCGLILLFLGVVLHTQYSEYFEFLETSFFNVSVWCIVMGVIVAVVSFFGEDIFLGVCKIGRKTFEKRISF